MENLYSWKYNSMVFNRATSLSIDVIPAFTIRFHPLSGIVAVAEMRKVRIKIKRIIRLPFPIRKHSPAKVCHVNPTLFLLSRHSNQSRLFTQPPPQPLRQYGKSFRSSHSSRIFNHSSSLSISVDQSFSIRFLLVSTILTAHAVSFFVPPLHDICNRQKRWCESSLS
jgi:hypothetical protein